MEKANLPTENASEPREEAYQPWEETMTPRPAGQPTKKCITFADDTDTEKSPSQRSSNYREALSQPAAGLSHRQRLAWLQLRRTAGLWVQCDDCNRWRYLNNVLDRYELPDKWYCRMNQDTNNADCSIPETPIPIHMEEDLIHSEYSAGSLVWARLPGWPWWPAMVDDCPDTEQYYWLDGFSDIPTHYNVVFFDSLDVTRAWVSPDNLKPYVANKKTFMPFVKDKKFKSRLQIAMAQADDATRLSGNERLEKCSFLARYKGNFNTPKKINKKELAKHKKYLKRKYNIEFDGESDSEEEYQPKSMRNNNAIMLGTPKSVKTKASRKVIEIKDTIDEGKNTDKTVDVIEAALENLENGKQNTESVNDIFKRPNSLVVQVGSTVENEDSAAIEEPFDNDTSKTYVPPEKESQESTMLTQDTVTSEITQFEVRIASPKSDDFDF